ncbi:hypothetical protein [Paludisphaera rhizosphaerae]|uniref:hypothetical protein n=1 Tax=Paludisphaera rhizosphaerae TaxID=2711216 RepID=UPI0013E9A3A8|nr:hypothetical protein [Paludisphaera rhizosphaerae]
MSIASLRLLLASFSTAACLAIVAGCGDGAPPAESTTEQATVQGKITIKGKPATKGQVVFDPRNINRRDAKIATADIGADGTYKTTTAIGRNSVTVVVPHSMKSAEGMTPELGFEVKAGNNTLDVELPYKPQ